MTDIAAQLRENGIHLKDSRPGRHYTTCPKCSANRKGAAHKNAKVLGVSIDRDGAHWGCNHCSWTGTTRKVNGAGPVENLITYDYLDETGTLLFQKVRGPNKKFWQRRPDGKGGWVKGRGDRAVLYRLPEVSEAIESGHTVCVVEGEKDVDGLWRINVPATCNPDGASEPGKKPKWRPEYSEMLRGADIVVMGDNDPAGRAHVEATASASVGIAGRVRVLDLAKHWRSCPIGGDVSDWLKAGHTREQLDLLIEQAPGFRTDQQPDKALIVTLSDWLSRDLPAPDFILGNWLTTTSRTLVVAPTGIGKTMLGVGMTLAVASGNGFLHWHGVRPARTLFIDGEMSRRLLKRASRMKCVASVLDRKECTY
jgi:hypothetical protein